MGSSNRSRIAIAAALACAAAPLFAGGVVELEHASPVATITSEEIEKVSIARDALELARLVPNAAGVTRFSGEPGDYSLTVRGGSRIPIRIDDNRVTSLTLRPDGTTVPRTDPFQTTFVPADASAQRNHSIGYRVENQLITIELGTPYGTIYVSAPELAPAGGSTTWTATAIAAGASDRERRRNQTRLDGMRVEIGIPSVELVPGGSVVVAAGRSQIVGLREGRSVVASGTIPFLHSPTWNGGTGGLDTGASTGLPPVFAGGALTIPGRFDGSTGNTRVLVGGRPVRVVAESPYGVSIYTPTDRIGALDIVVEEGEQTGSGTFYNLGLEIFADQYDLVRGQTTTCHVRVLGLERVGETVELLLINRTPGIVSMAPSNRELVRIHPGAHDASGVLQLDRRFTAVGRGRFNLQAILIPPGARLPGSGR